MTMETYASLWQIRAAINTQSQVENQDLLDAADVTSRRIDNLLESEVPLFLPYVETREQQITSYNINSALGTFMLDSPLLELTTVSAYNVDITSRVAAYPPSAFPITRLRMSNTCWYSWYSPACGFDCTLAPLISITGVWGYRRRGGTRWRNIGTLDAGIDASVTAIVVDDLNGNPITQERSQLSAGNLLRIDSEYMIKEYTANGQTVERDVNGTTPAAHLAGATVYVWQVEEPIARVVARQAGLMLARQGAYDIRGSNELGTPIIYPSDLLGELYGALTPYAR
jgi:hypothetical protein